APAICPRILKCTVEGGAECRADGVNGLGIEVGNAVVPLGGGTLILIPEAGRDGELGCGAPVVLDVHAKRVSAECRIHGDVGLAAAGAEEHIGNRVAADALGVLGLAGTAMAAA